MSDVCLRLAGLPIAKCVLFVTATAGCAFAARGNESETQEIRAFVQTYCLDCHTGDASEAGFELSGLLAEKPASGLPYKSSGLAAWEKIWKRCVSRQMPPPDTERPDEKAYDDFLQLLSGALEAQAEEKPVLPATPALRRMTRYEYANSVRDLLGVVIDPAEYLPADPGSQGFDNITVGELSPTLLNRYLQVAETVSRLAVGRHSGVTGATYRFPADRTQDWHVAGLPLGTRGGGVITHTFPKSGEYEIAIRLMRDRDEKVEGLNRDYQIDLLVDRQKLAQLMVKKPPGRDYTHVDTSLSAKIKVKAGTRKLGVTFPNENSSFIESKRQPFDASFNRHRHPRRRLAIFQVSVIGPLGDHQKQSEESATLSRQLIFGGRTLGQLQSGEIESWETERKRAEAERIIGRLAQQAYRRKVTDDDLAIPLSFFEQQIELGFEAGIEAAIAAILVNPNFLFKVEETAFQEVPEGEVPESVVPISDFELATRLSYFLWSSLPDSKLWEAAEDGSLRDQLETQVKRMLLDSRSNALTENFAGQWLYLRNLENLTPDLRSFPDFDDNLRQAFRGETEHLFRNMVEQDLSVTALIQSDFTFLNQRLAEHYDIPGVYGSHFRKVTLREANSSSASLRGGILRHGSVLMLTSYATRTSPTVRGNWILNNLIGTPPPPPPPNVPNLKENTSLESSSIRERLAVHRENPACASCHNLMDPIGFALENFDAIGRWRDYEGTLSIDSLGTLPDGTNVSSLEELERGILRRPELLAHTMAEKLMTYALGRGLTPEDGPAVRKILRRARDEEFSFSSIVQGIVASRPFQMRANIDSNRLVEPISIRK